MADVMCRAEERVCKPRSAPTHWSKPLKESVVNITPVCSEFALFAGWFDRPREVTEAAHAAGAPSSRVL